MQKLDKNLDIIQSAPVELSYLDGDLNIIQKLDDEPNDVGGLTSSELKETFDRSGNIIKEYINEVLVPNIEPIVQNEKSRCESENERRENEQERVSSENERVSNEEERVLNEEGRVTAETARDAAEQAREEAEEQRAAAYPSVIQTVTDAAASALAAKAALEQSIVENPGSTVIDPTLSVAGAAAEAAAVGQLKEDLANTESRLSESIAEISDCLNNGSTKVIIKWKNGYILDKATKTEKKVGGEQYAITEKIKIKKDGHTYFEKFNTPTWASLAWLTFDDFNAVVKYGESIRNIDLEGASYIVLSDYNADSDHGSASAIWYSDMKSDVNLLSKTMNIVEDSIYEQNLLNGIDADKVLLNYRIGDDGEMIYANDYCTFDRLVVVKPNTIYTAWHIVNKISIEPTDRIWLAFYDANGKHTPHAVEGIGKYRSPKNALYARFSTYTSYRYRLIFEEGSEKPYSKYIPFINRLKIRDDVEIPYHKNVSCKINSTYVRSAKSPTTLPIEIYCQNYFHFMNCSAPIYAMSVRTNGKQMLYRSDDGGVTWIENGFVEVNSSIGELIKAIYVEPWERTLYAIKYMGDSENKHFLMSYDITENGLVQIGSLDIGVSYAHSSDHNFDSSLDSGGHAYTLFATYGEGTEEEMYVYKTVNRGRSWNKILTKGSRGGNGEIRHFHSVQIDPFTQDIWVATGDTDSECGIFISRDNGRTWRRTYHGNQNARTLGFVFEKDSIYYGMDSPVEDYPSYVYKIDRTIFDKCWDELLDYDLARDMIAKCPNGWAVYSLTRCFFPKGFLVFYVYEKKNGSKYNTILPIDFYDYDTKEMIRVAEFDISSVSDDDYVGIMTASRYQDEISGKVFMHPIPSLYHIYTGVKLTKYAPIWSMEINM